jgi:NhaP-type Na+/H+ or K+/H+ antiporter
MPNRIAASLALVAFAMCLLVGLQADNTFSTTILRALLAMGGTYVIGLVLGMMGGRMLEENLKAEEEKLKNSSQKLETNDR